MRAAAVIVAGRGAVIVRARGMLVNRSAGDGDGYGWDVVIEAGDELAVKDEKTGRVWGVVFRRIIIFSDGKAVEAVAEEGEAIRAVRVVAKFGVARIGRVLVGAVVGGGVREGWGL